MKNRKSRFEVGYGLEGDLPDAITRRALDDILRPSMRKGDTTRAIIDSFGYLSAVKEEDRSFAGRYFSVERYQRYLQSLKRKNQRYLEKGYLRETSPGIYEFTKAYYSSSEYRSSSGGTFRSSGSSRSSSSSSSSGGGSSGGGGSSSSW